MNFLANSARVNPVAFRTLAKLHVVGQRFSPKRLMRLLLLNDELMDVITKFVSREELQREQVVGMEIKPVR